MPRVEKFNDLITADHKVPSEESGSRNNHRYARGGTILGNPVVTVPPVQNKNFPGHPEEPNEVVGASKETKSHLH